MTLRTPGERLWWALGSAVVVVYALVPVAWIVSLSLKPAAQLNDNRFLPQSISLDNYRAIFQDPQFPAALWNSLGIASLSALTFPNLGEFDEFGSARFFQLFRSDGTGNVTLGPLDDQLGWAAPDAAQAAGGMASSLRQPVYSLPVIP